MSQVLTTLTKPNAFSFYFTSDVSFTSAGVYNSSNQLIRTLWANVPYKAGTHTEFWDGNDDNGNLQTYGNTYTVKVHSNNNTLVWEGVIGNNSTATTGTTKWKTATPFCDMVQIGTKMCCCTAFNEGVPSHFKFDVSAPLTMINYENSTTHAGSIFVCANATYRCFSGKEYSGVQNFVYPELVSNDIITTFSAGVTMTPSAPSRVGNSYSGVINLNSLGNAGIITGMDIQQAGNGYLFVAQAGQNQICVYKTSDGSGSLVQTITMTAPTNLKLETDSILWVAQGTTLTKYSVNSDGTITITGSQITGFARIAGLDILSGTIGVFDAGNQQIPKFYNSTTLASITKGTWLSGGHASTPIVANNRFYIEDLRGKYFTYLRFQSDGSFWIGDTGNYRQMHFDSTGTYINNISFVPLYTPLNDGTNQGVSYNTVICKGQNTSIFNELNEYTINYSNPLSSGWTLANNWGYNLPVGWHNNGINNSVALLSNSRKYMVIGKSNNNTFRTTFGVTTSTSTTGGNLSPNTYYYLIFAQNGGLNLESAEFSITTTGTTSSNTINWNSVVNATSYRVYRGTASGTYTLYYSSGSSTSLVDTGAAGTSGSPTSYNSQFIAELTSTGLRIINTIVPQNFSMDTSGNLIVVNKTGSGATSTVTYQKFTLTGFDANNNPTYNLTPVTIATLLIGNQGPSPTQTNFLTTTSGKIIVFDPGQSNPRSGTLPIFHLGAYDQTTFAQDWLNCASTFDAYSGDYPIDGTYDIGNSINYGGGIFDVAGNNIMWNYHGENWKKSQTGVFYIYDESGLLKALGGVVGPAVHNQIAPYGFFSNGLTGGITQVGADYYMYFCDESQHNGLHRFKLSNTVSENFQNINLVLSSRTLVISSNRVDLLATLPDSQASVSGATGWSESQAEFNTSGTNQFYTQTRINTFDFKKSPDINVVFKTSNPTALTLSVKRQVTPLTNLTNWVVSGQLYLSSFNVPGQWLYIKLEDVNNKTLLKLGITNAGLYVNDVLQAALTNNTYGASDFSIKRIGSNIYLLLNFFGNLLQLLVNKYDPTAVITNPGYFSLNNDVQTGVYGFQIGVTKLFFEGN